MLTIGTLQKLETANKINKLFVHYHFQRLLDGHQLLVWYANFIPSWGHNTYIYLLYFTFSVWDQICLPSNFLPYLPLQILYKVQMICMVCNASECKKLIYFAVSTCRSGALINTLAYHMVRLKNVRYSQKCLSVRFWLKFFNMLLLLMGLLLNFTHTFLKTWTILYVFYEKKRNIIVNLSI